MGIRTIIFRGKRKDNGEWIEGYYASQSNHACFAHELKYTHFIFKDIFLDFNLGGLQEFEVIPETVEQFTGLTDNNGKRIFEGDIVQAHFRTNHSKQIFRVTFNDGMFIFNNGYVKLPVREIYGIKVIGNIHDNPELLKGGEG